ncbi:unnamed protein product [Durusdinium trenchii]|uniref:Uncharacterized protein n=1 Tax=Durusdinium trenchii TaxID=1381693 RepID=A0ABP0MFS1_9DINO
MFVANMRLRQCVEDSFAATSLPKANAQRCGTAFQEQDSRFSDFFSNTAAPKKITRADAAHFLSPRASTSGRAAAFNYTVEEAAHAAHHSNEEQRVLKKALAKDHSLTAEEAKFFSFISGPLTFLTSMFAITAAYLEVQNGWMLSQ